MLGSSETFPGGENVGSEELGLHDFSKEEEFYSGEGEVLATRGEIKLDELVHANMKKRSIGMASRLGTQNSSYSHGHWGRPASKIYCHQGNPTLFNAVSNIVRRKESANRKFPWALMDCSSSTSASSRGLNPASYLKPAGPSGFLKHGKGKIFKGDLCRTSHLEANGSSDECSTKTSGVYFLLCGGFL